MQKKLELKNRKKKSEWNNKYLTSVKESEINKTSDPNLIC